MANWPDPQPGMAAQAATTTVGQGVAYDAGLRSHMLSVYNYMTSGILLTGVVALLFSQWEGAPAILFGPGILKYLIMFAPLGFVLVLSFGINRLSQGTAQILYWAFATVMGVSLSAIFFVYTGSSIALTFFATAASFASLSLYGYTTKRDLSGMGTFLLMGLVGLIVASIVNLFWMNNTFSLAIAAIGVLIFAGLTVYDTQRIKSLYFQIAGTEFVGKAAIMGALTLYLDFINMFLYLLRFMGSRD
ncbi:MAG TPA: Bax inhibitor-1/YccA family protein [Allosphingosinicella sp.]|nr:Bax inhibitor-1/YccA family protein [Allosphingosinicella sp.]